MVLLFLFLALIGACSDKPDPTGTEEDVSIDGVTLSATVVELSDKLVSVQVTLTNTTGDDIDLHYPAGCPVRIRFYRALDSALVYDEANFPCNVTDAVELHLAPGAQRVLTSGTRFTWQISGDSLPVGAYEVTGLLRIIGHNPIELPAGIYTMRIVSPPAQGAEKKRMIQESRFRIQDSRFTIPDSRSLIPNS